ncbi:MAG: DNA mismatch repair protein MutS [Bacillota bacterium]
MSGFTPMIEQYRSIKKEYADCILFFRLGDFYEMFFEDAETASRELDIVLTAREGGQRKIPMCGVPYHAANNYIKRLLDRGYRVAICDQVEDPRQAKGIVQREVTRVITPGTALDDSWLTEDNNFLAALVVNAESAGLAYLDLLTGDFGACQLTGARVSAGVLDEMARIKPAECLVPMWSSQEVQGILGDELPGTMVTEIDPMHFTLERAYPRLEKYFGQRSEIMQQLKEKPEASSAAGALLGFVEETQKVAMNQLRRINIYRISDYLGLDKTSRRNLELTNNLRDGKSDGTLLAILDRTCTAMGRRKLRAWLEQPLLDSELINERLEAVEELLLKRGYREDLQSVLQRLRDMERIAGKIGAGVVNPRELLALKVSLEEIPGLKRMGTENQSPLLCRLFNLNELQSARELIGNAIDETAPVNLRDGGIIRSGYNQQVDELRQIAFKGEKWLLDYEQAEKERTGIKSLKIGYNRVFGYYLEVTKAYLSQVPSDYVRKQTLVNAERYITEELKKYENEVLGAKDRLIALEQDLFSGIRQALQADIEDIQILSQQIAEIDALASLAQVAFENRYHRPRINHHGPIRIRGGRHPVVEQFLGGARFVPNDIDLDPAKSRIGIVTGPNMGGKSTFLRQVALIVIMAQMGSFVPAEEAEIGLVDHIFTRVGASDDLSTGKSTFMVEMIEVANILGNATSRSLVILDEVGRGTSTYDGMSIARALAEHLASIDGIRVLFATHYHELTDLADKYPPVFNLCVSVKESGDDVIFLRKVLPGKADKSYGIHVAKLAGLPPVVTRRAEEILDTLEVKSPQSVPFQLSLFGDEEDLVIDEINSVDINRLTPLEALNLIHEWKQKLNLPDRQRARARR